MTGGGDVDFDPTPTFATKGERDAAMLDVDTFRTELLRLDGDGDDADYVLAHLQPRFTGPQMEARLKILEGRAATRSQAGRTVGLIREIAERSYSVRFESATPVSERVLLPAMGAESGGMEDARFVRFTDDDSSVTYYATYTAYDGSNICQQLLETKDFESFTSSPMVGAAATNKGLALFPRRINDRFVALSRCDRESNTIAFSRSPRHWGDPLSCQTPTESWEVLQLGNCGSPIETDSGWLALTHGVGPMRTYHIGAILLDLDDPTRIIGRLRRAAAQPDPRRARRVRAQCRVLLRRTPPCRHPRHPLRCRRFRNRSGHGPGGRTAHCAHGGAPMTSRPPQQKTGDHHA